jgi:predicted ATPase
MNFKLEFKNYKSFKAKQTIEFKPITILIGPNSAGKSSIMKLLAFLKQSMENNRNDILSWRKPLVDMIGYSKVAHRGNGKPVEVGITAKVNVGVAWEEIENSKFKSPELKVKLKIHSDDEISGEIGEKPTSVYKYTSTMQRSNESAFLGERVYIYPPKSLENIYSAYLRKALKYSAKQLELQKIILPNYKNIDRLIDNFLHTYLGGETDCYGFVPKGYGTSKVHTFLNFSGPLMPYLTEGDSKLENLDDLRTHFDQLLSLSNPDKTEDLAAIEKHIRNYCHVLIWRGVELKGHESTADEALAHLRTKTEKLFKSLEFFPPLRPEPKKYYSRSELVAFTGEKSFEKPEFLDFVNIYLSILGFETELKFELLAENEDLYKIIIRDIKTGYESSLSDVGYGYSQVLPIIFAKTRVRKTVCLEQPELHLHPQAQGALADLIVNDVLSTSEKNDGHPGHALHGINILYGDAKWQVRNGRSFLSNNYIIETHSEHLLRGLQLKVAEGVLNTEDIAVYYVSRNKAGNGFVDAIKIEANGFFNKPIPPGFYDSTTQLLEKLWEAQN